MFMGSSVQVDDILDWFGNPTGTSTLGASVTEIFNNEFLLQPFQLVRQRGVPVSRMDLSGYGASIFSDWLNPHAAIAETSQAKFDVTSGAARPRSSRSEASFIRGRLRLSAR